MDTTHAKRIILVSTGGMLVITTVGWVAEKKDLPSAKVPLGAFIAGVALEVLAEFQPMAPFAAGLAMVAFITTTFVFGGPAFDALKRVTAQPK